MIGTEVELPVTIELDYGKQTHEGIEVFLKCPCGWETTVYGTFKPQQIATIHIRDKHEGQGGVHSLRAAP